ncbi:MAG: polysaccharide deacetylase family protein [Bacteroidales bacterium]|nr:polysaccharide deacetylase family protein [Bacteroidales bacterium]
MYKLGILIVLVLFGAGVMVTAQKQVAITIDDVPNIRKYQLDGKIAFLTYLSENNIPSAIFINESRLLKDSDASNNYLKPWIDDKYVTVGSHTYSHPHYSEVELEEFTKDIIKGLVVSTGLAAQTGKTIDYFRFPFNDLGNDLNEHNAIQDVLDSLHLILTPFTVESSDWMFNSIYEYYLKNDSINKAEEIGRAYVDATMKSFEWMDSLTIAQYGRTVKHIYLCHDNSINADYLPIIVDKLRASDYQFISLDDAMNDEVYQQPSHFHKSWGISWVYRWMTDEEERKKLMRQEPGVMEYYKIYERIRSVPKY